MSGDALATGLATALLGAGITYATLAVVRGGRVSPVAFLAAKNLLTVMWLLVQLYAGDRTGVAPLRHENVGWWICVSLLHVAAQLLFLIGLALGSFSSCAAFASVRFKPVDCASGLTRVFSRSSPLWGTEYKSKEANLLRLKRSFLRALLSQALSLSVSEKGSPPGKKSVTSDRTFLSQGFKRKMP